MATTALRETQGRLFEAALIEPPRPTPPGAPRSPAVTGAPAGSVGEQRHLPATLGPLRAPLRARGCRSGEGERRKTRNLKLPPPFETLRPQTVKDETGLGTDLCVAAGRAAPASLN